MYGISFLGHADLRRILTDYGFTGHPLRKDFPLTGAIEVRYSVNEQSVVYEKPGFTQFFRNYQYIKQSTESTSIPVMQTAPV
jgi:NADH-quinone oxidoreductase subunit C